MKTVLTILYSLLVFSAAGQGYIEIEQDLLKQFNRIAYWQAYRNDSIESSDSLQIANEDFRKSLLTYTSTFAPTLTYEFTELQKAGVYIASSPDKLFRIYSWDTSTGGTMHIFDNVYQYKAGSKVYAKTIMDTNNPGDPGYFYAHIYSINRGQKICYLAIRNAIYSSKTSYQGVKAFTITANSLDDSVKLIKTKTGIRNALGFEFDFFSVSHREERPVNLIDFDPSTKTLFIPIVLENGEVTNKFITYQFTGDYLERKN